MIGRCQILFYEPGMTKVVSRTIGFTDLRGFGILINDRGNLDLTPEKRAAIREAVRDVRRIAPDTSVTVCKRFSMDGADHCGVYSHGPSENLIVLSAAFSPAYIRTTAVHEAFHRCEYLLTDDESDVIEAWADSLPVPGTYSENWWSSMPERLAWGFQQYVYLRDEWNDQQLAEDFGFKLTTDDLPQAVIRIYENVITGKVGQRALPQPKKEGSVIKSVFMRFFGTEEKKKAA